MDYKEKYEQALERAREWRLHNDLTSSEYERLEYIFPELCESEDEKIRKTLVELVKCNERCGYFMINNTTTSAMLAWLEKQGEQEVNEPDWCHHKVDLSDCSEEYRKAYYDGWNNCNQQHSQCKSEWNDVVKCLINGMKFYYEDNEEATWGTEKFSMKVKDILSWLEKQGRQKPQRMISAEAKEVMYDKPAYAWSEDDEKMRTAVLQLITDSEKENDWNCVYCNDKEIYFSDIIAWLKSLEQRIGGKL